MLRPSKPKHSKSKKNTPRGVALVKVSGWNGSQVKTNFVKNELECKHKELIVLDLNGTLLHRTKGGKQSMVRMGYPRPHLSTFLRFILDNFAVMVWSSAQPNNVHQMVDKLFSGMGNELVRVWDRRFCELDGEYFDKSASIKDLTRIVNGWSLKDSPYRNIYRGFDKYMGVAPNAAGRWSLDSIVLIDDSEDKAVRQPGNHINISTFENINKPDYVLQSLVEYLRTYTIEKSKYRSIIDYMKVHPWAEFSANARTKPQNLGSEGNWRRRA